MRLRETARGTAQREERAAALAAARASEVRHLASVRMPEISRRVRGGRRLDGVPGQLTPPAVVGEDFSQALATVTDALGSDEAVRRERALRDSVQAAFESVARNMHAMATVQLQVLDNVEKIISDPRLMTEVMRADHAAAQMTRKAQTLLVMCGIWPARRESRPVSLYDCVRGAQSRIVEFGRVEVHGGQTLHAVPPAVEGMMHAIAELLENATVFSPSSTQVVVTVREVGAGAVIEIDDAGLGMPPDTLQQAVGQLRDDVDLATLGAVPRLGLACVGRWSRELGLNVELTGASAYGGTRAVVFVPHRLLTEPLSREPRREENPQTHHGGSAPGGSSLGGRHEEPARERAGTHPHPREEAPRPPADPSPYAEPVAHRQPDPAGPRTGSAPYGGTRAVVFVPHRLLTEPPWWVCGFSSRRGSRDSGSVSSRCGTNTTARCRGWAWPVSDAGRASWA
nr:ATP-binding protein [Streptomyces tardus]